MDTQAQGSVPGGVSRAVAFLHSIDVTDLAIKIGSGPGGHLRACCLRKLRVEFGLSEQQANHAIDVFIGPGDQKPTAGQVNQRPEDECSGR